MISNVFVQYINPFSRIYKKYLTGNVLSVEFKLLQCNIFSLPESLHPRLLDLLNNFFLEI